MERAVRDNKKLDLIVWPETAYPLPFVIRDPQLTESEFERQARVLDRFQQGPRVLERLGSAGRRPAPMTGPTRSGCPCWWEAPPTTSGPPDSRR